MKTWSVLIVLLLTAATTHAEQKQKTKVTNEMDHIRRLEVRVFDLEQRLGKIVHCKTETHSVGTGTITEWEWFRQMHTMIKPYDVKGLLEPILWDTSRWSTEANAHAELVLQSDMGGTK